MPGLAKLPDTQGPGVDILIALRELHLLAGEPSVRDIARLTGHALSSATVHRVLTQPEVPRWGTLEPVVEALGGDVESFRHLWISARRAMENNFG